MTERRRFIVTLETGNGWQELLEQAARMAQAMRAELHTCLIEDDDLHTIAELPFTVEISLFRGQRRELSPEALQRNQRDYLRQARALVDKTLRESRLKGGFQTSSRQQADSDRRSGDISWQSRHTPFSELHLRTPVYRETLYLLLDGNGQDASLLEIADLLMHQDYRRLIVLVRNADEDSALNQRLKDLHKPFEVRRLDPALPLAEIINGIDNYAGNTLLIHSDTGGELSGQRLLQLLGSRRFESLVLH